MITPRFSRNLIRRASKPAAVTWIALFIPLGCGKDAQRSQEPTESQMSLEANSSEFTELDNTIEEASLALMDIENLDWDETSIDPSSNISNQVQSSKQTNNTSDTQGNKDYFKAGARLPFRSCIDMPEKGQTLTRIRKAAVHFGAVLGNQNTREFRTRRIIDIERSWSKNGASVGCNPSTQRALITPDNLDGVKLEVTFKRFIAGAVKDLPKNDLGAAALIAKGQKTFLFEQKTEGERIIRTITMEGSVWRIAGYQANDKQLAGTLEIKTSNGPLVMITERDIQSYRLLSRKIASGHMTATRGNGSSLDISYQDLKFERNSNCTAPSFGTISGTHISRLGGTRNFELIFSENGNGSLQIVTQGGRLTKHTFKPSCSSTPIN